MAEFRKKEGFKNKQKFLKQKRFRSKKPFKKRKKLEAKKPKRFEIITVPDPYSDGTIQVRIPASLSGEKRQEMIDQKIEAAMKNAKKAAEKRKRKKLEAKRAKKASSVEQRFDPSKLQEKGWIVASRYEDGDPKKIIKKRTYDDEGKKKNMIAEQVSYERDGDVAEYIKRSTYTTNYEEGPDPERPYIRKKIKYNDSVPTKKETWFTESDENDEDVRDDEVIKYDKYGRVTSKEDKRQQLQDKRRRHRREKEIRELGKKMASMESEKKREKFLRRHDIPALHRLDTRIEQQKKKSSKGGEKADVIITTKKEGEIQAVKGYKLKEGDWSKPEKIGEFTGVAARRKHAEVEKKLQRKNKIKAAKRKREKQALQSMRERTERLEEKGFETAGEVVRAVQGKQKKRTKRKTGKKDKLAGFKKRIRGLQRREERFFGGEGMKRISTTAGIFTQPVDVAKSVISHPRAALKGKFKVTPTKQRSWLGQTVEKYTAGLMSTGIALGPAVAVAGEKTAATGEAIYHEETRGRVAGELGRTGVETAKEFDPRTPKGAATLGTVATFGAIAQPAARASFIKRGLIQPESVTTARAVPQVKERVAAPKEVKVTEGGFAEAPSRTSIRGKQVQDLSMLKTVETKSRIGGRTSIEKGTIEGDVATSQVKTGGREFFVKQTPKRTVVKELRPVEEVAGPKTKLGALAEKTRISQSREPVIREKTFKPTSEEPVKVERSKVSQEAMTKTKEKGVEGEFAGDIQAKKAKVSEAELRGGGRVRKGRGRGEVFKEVRGVETRQAQVKAEATPRVESRIDVRLGELKKAEFDFSPSKRTGVEEVFDVESVSITQEQPRIRFVEEAPYPKGEDVVRVEKRGETGFELFRRQQSRLGSVEKQTGRGEIIVKRKKAGFDWGKKGELRPVEKPSVVKEVEAPQPGQENIFSQSDISRAGRGTELVREFMAEEKGVRSEAMRSFAQPIRERKERVSRKNRQVGGLDIGSRTRKEQRGKAEMDVFFEQEAKTEMDIDFEEDTMTEQETPFDIDIGFPTPPPTPPSEPGRPSEPTPPPPPPPLFPFGDAERKKKRKKGKQGTKRPFKYSPSLAAELFDITAKKKPAKKKRYTGFEVRPVIEREEKRKDFFGLGLGR